ncbi:hypothetical protein HHK36_028371 [Tetracentron sinense]|uniref:Nucleotide-diphospho-sugar transferase domain-containing protein n=1 Tax=Tetracentron sinense TaxID=13715 RepID=A0A834YFA3_TETSI|nr:hypothetical protein HHK36_028371 [Tetracentron sinense]
MAWSPFQDVAKSKPLFLTIYATILIGIVFSSVYVFSAIYSGKPIYTSTWSSSSSSVSPVGSPHIDNAHNFSRPTTEGKTLAPSSQPQSIWTRPIWEVPPHGSIVPPLKDFRLTKELVKHRVKDNIIIVTFGNYAFMDFILTWVKHSTDLGLSNLLVGAMDTKVLEALYWKGVPVFDMGSHMSTIDVGWGSPTFHKMGREKVILIDAMLPFGYELLMCDTDMVWLKNPLPYFARFPGADILTSSDQVVPTVVDDRLEIWQQGAAFNIGIFHWRPTDSAKKLAKEWKDLLLADEKLWDQNGFNDLVRRQFGPSVDKESGLVYAFDGNLKLGILPATTLQAMYQQLRLEPYAVHTTFQYAGTEGKRHRLREAMVFYDQPEYYDSPGNLSFSLHKMLDRLWFQHPGVLVGTMTRQPFLCPMDHVFEVNVMLRELPKEEFGPGIHFREYSFFDNSLLPKQVKKSWLDVQLCQGGSQDCHVSNKTIQPGVLRFPKHSSEETMVEDKFRNRVKRYVGIWCCVENHTPGHIYYDMYWDEKPSWKPIPPQTPEDDHPPCDKLLCDGVADIVLVRIEFGAGAEQQAAETAFDVGSGRELRLVQATQGPGFIKLIFHYFSFHPNQKMSTKIELPQLLQFPAKQNVDSRRDGAVAQLQSDVVPPKRRMERICSTSAHLCVPRKISKAHDKSDPDRLSKLQKAPEVRVFSPLKLNEARSQ